LEMGVSWPICLGWSWTTILLISAFQVARIQATATSTRLSQWWILNDWKERYHENLMVKVSGFSTFYFPNFILKVH
jgi:hypothetical protein